TPTISVPGGTATGPFELTISFAEAVTGFAAGDVEVTGGSRASSFAGGHGSTSFVLGITPANDSAGEITIGVPAGASVDGAGNPSLAATPQTRPFGSSTPPGVTITDDTGGTASGNVIFTFTFTEPVNGFTASDVEVSAGGK